MNKVQQVRRLTDELDPQGDYSDEELENRLENHKGDSYRLAAEIWEEKAARVTENYDFSADGASLSRSQLVKQMQRAAAFCRSRSRVNYIVIGGHDATTAK